MDKNDAILLYNLAVTGTRQTSLDEAAQLLQKLAQIKADIEAMPDPQINSEDN